MADLEGRLPDSGDCLGFGGHEKHGHKQMSRCAADLVAVAALKQVWADITKAFAMQLGQLS